MRGAYLSRTLIACIPKHFMHTFAQICTVEYVRDRDIGPGPRHIPTQHTATVLRDTVQNVGYLIGEDVEELVRCEHEIYNNVLVSMVI